MRGSFFDLYGAPETQIAEDDETFGVTGAMKVACDMLCDPSRRSTNYQYQQGCSFESHDRHANSKLHAYLGPLFHMERRLTVFTDGAGGRSVSFKMDPFSVAVSNQLPPRLANQLWHFVSSSIHL